MMNSPCAMLITPIWPKVKFSPRAASSRTAPIAAAVGSCARRASIRPFLGRGSGAERGRALRRAEGVAAGAAAAGVRGTPSCPGRPRRSGPDRGGPVVAGQVGVGGDRAAGVPHLGDGAVRADPADPGGLGQVLGAGV